MYIVVSNPAGRVDVIEHGSKEPYKSLPIEMMYCSFMQGNHLFIGALNKVYLVDVSRDFEIVSSCTFNRHVSSICSMNPNQFVIGQQGGFLAMIEVTGNGEIMKVAENKITGAIYKVIKTSNVDEFALACSGGLYFAKYEPEFKRFTVSSDYLLVDHLVTQVVEISFNKFAVGIWG